MRLLTKVSSVLLAALAATAATAQDLPRAIGLGSNPQGSFSYTAATAVAAAISKGSPMEGRVQPMTGSTSYLGMVNDGTMLVGISSGPDIAMSYRGMEPFREFKGLRLIGDISRFNGALVSRRDLDLKSLADGKGKRIAGAYTSHLISLLYTEAALKTNGLTWDDFTMIPVTNFAGGLQGLKEGTIDIVFTTIDSGQIREAAAVIDGGIRYLPTIPEGVEGAVDTFKEVMPGMALQAVKADSADGIDFDMQVMGWDVYAITGDTTSEDVAYAVAKAMWDQIEEMRGTHAAIAQWLNYEFLVQVDFDVPYHDGAVKFYKEMDAWTPAHEARQQELLAISG